MSEMEAEPGLASESLDLSADSTELSESYGGECQEERPYGKVFTVIRAGAVWISCTHEPPHQHRIA